MHRVSCQCGRHCAQSILSVWEALCTEYPVSVGEYYISIKNSGIRRMAAEVSTTRTVSDEEKEKEMGQEEFDREMERITRNGRLSISDLSERFRRFMSGKILPYIILHTKCISPINTGKGNDEVDSVGEALK